MYSKLGRVFDRKRPTKFFDFYNVVIDIKDILANNPHGTDLNLLTKDDATSNAVLRLLTVDVSGGVEEFQEAARKFEMVEIDGEATKFEKASANSHDGGQKFQNLNLHITTNFHTIM